MKLEPRRLCVPVALIAASCAPAPPVCTDPQPLGKCWPDGGFICSSSDCSPAREADGGLVYADVDAGAVQCLC
jgi:hypothetical protein